MENFIVQDSIFLISVGVAIVAFNLMKFDSSSILYIKDYTLFDKIVVFFYALYLYFQKTLLPFGYCAIYNYPQKVHGVLPYYCYIGAALAMAGLGFVFLSKHSNAVIKGGVLFFLVSIAPVIQLFPNTYTFMADRYSYLPTLGFVGIIVVYFYNTIIKKNANKIEAYAFAIIVCIGLAFITNQRTKIWQDTLTLYTDIYNQKQTTPSIFVQFGNVYRDRGNLPMAVFIYQQGDSLFPNQISIKLMIASGFASMGRVDESIKVYQECLLLDPNFAPIYLNLSGCYFKKRDIQKALELSLKAMELEPQNPMYIYDVGYTYLALNEKEKGLFYIKKAASFSFKPALDFLLANKIIGN